MRRNHKTTLGIRVGLELLFLSRLNLALAFLGMKLETRATAELNCEISSQFLSSEQPCTPKSFHVTLNITDVEKNTLGKLVVEVSAGGHSFPV